MTQIAKRQPNHILRRERQLRGWSQQKLAEMLDTGMDQISRWENGWAMPSPYYREQLCTIFGKDAIQLGFLPGQEPEMQPSPLAPMNTPVAAASTILVIQVCAIRFSLNKKGPTCSRMSDLGESLVAPSFN